VELYKVSLRPLLDLLLNKGIITCFAYGQTGSGKTYTMVGMQSYFVNDLYNLMMSGKFK